MFQFEDLARRRHHKGGRHSTDLSLRVARSLVMGCLLLLPAALGGAHPATNVVLATLLLVACAMCLPRLHRQGRLQNVGGMQLLIAVALGWTLLQCVPMPLSLMRWLAPGAYAVLAPQLPEGAWHMAGLDASLICHELIKLVAYGAAAWLGVHLFRDRYRGQQLLVCIALSGAVVMSVGLVQAVFDIRRPYNVFGSNDLHLVATFINPNHLAGFLGFCCFIALTATQAETTPLRWALLGTCVICGAGVFMSLSRGGILALAVAWLFVAVSVPLRRRGIQSRWVQVGLAGMLILAAYLAHSRVVHEMFTLVGNTGFEKHMLWRPVPTLLRDFPLLGMGRGAFAAVFERYRPTDFPLLTFTHLENEWLQVLVDFGPIMGLLLLAGGARIIWRLLPRDAERPSSVLPAGLFLAIHNLADFNLELTALAFPVVLVLATLSHNERPNPTAHARGWQLALLAWTFAVVLLAVAAPVALQHTLLRDTARLTHALRESDVPLTERLARAERIVAWHPVDALQPLLVAKHLLEQEHDPKAALRWINRSLLRVPEGDGAHYLAGQALLSVGALEQGATMLQRACAINPSHTLASAHLLWQATEDSSWVARLAESDRDPVRLSVASFLLEHHAPGPALQALGVDLPGRDRQGAMLAARAYLDMHASEESRRVAAAAAAAWPRMPDGYVAEAKALMQMGDPKSALRVLDQGLLRSPYPEGLIPHAVGILADLGEFGRAEELARQLLERTGTATGETYRLLGLIEERQHRLPQALQYYERARDQAPANVAFQLAVARVHEALGDVHSAITALEQAKHSVRAPEIEARLQMLREVEVARRQSALHDAFVQGSLETLQLTP